MRDDSERRRTDILQGMLDVVILKTLAHEGLHGYAVAQRIRLIASEPMAPATGREAKFCRLTPKGRKQLEVEGIFGILGALLAAGSGVGRRGGRHSACGRTRRRRPGLASIASRSRFSPPSRLSCYGRAPSAESRVPSPTCRRPSQRPTRSQRPASGAATNATPAMPSPSEASRGSAHAPI